MPKLNNQERAMSALLETNSLVDAAKSCNLSERTLCRYLQDANFAREYRNARRAVVESAIVRMQNGASEAVDRLRELQYCENPAVAARCAQIIFENSVKSLETTDILERLERLENEHTKTT